MLPDTVPASGTGRGDPPRRLPVLPGKKASHGHKGTARRHRDRLHIARDSDDEDRWKPARPPAAEKPDTPYELIPDAGQPDGNTRQIGRAHV